MATNEIILKISIDGKEANATLNLTDISIKELYENFKYGKTEVNGLVTGIIMEFNNARVSIHAHLSANKAGTACDFHLDMFE